MKHPEIVGLEAMSNMAWRNRNISGFARRIVDVMGKRCPNW
jgi:hypothetical protein